MDAVRLEPGDRRIATAVFGVATVALVLHACSFLPFIADDALISLRYADRFLSGHGLTWTDGERVEGYSNLLWILIVAAAGRLGMDLIVAARLLGVASMAAVLVALLRAHPAKAGSGGLPAWAACLGFALSGPIAVWAIGGLEQPLVAALLGWTITLALRLIEKVEPLRMRDVLAPGLLLGMLCLTRPDGPLFVLGACGGIALARRRVADLPALAGMASLAALFVLSQLWFRQSYYGEWVPNPAFAKLGFTVQRLSQGMQYVGVGCLWMLPLVAGAATALAAMGDPRRRARITFLAVLLAIWSAYVAIIGGDIFPARRHLVPVVLLLCFMLAEGLRGLETRLPAGRLARAAPWLLGALLVAQSVDPETVRARSERWEWDGEVVGRFLSSGFGALNPLLAVDPAGCVPYFSRLRSIDMLGLNDRYLARNPPQPIGTGWLGHELGDGAYVLRREPDLVLFCSPRGSFRGCFASGKQMMSDPSFVAGYSPVTVEADRPYTLQSHVWVRREGGKLGVRREHGRVTVPGWLLAGNRASVARLGPDEQVGMSASRDAPAILRGLPLEAGRWTVRAEGTNPDLVVALFVPERNRPIAEGPAGLSMTLEQAPPNGIALVVAPASGATGLVYRVIFERPERITSAQAP